MCLIVLAYQADPRFPVILGGNRDEFFKRPTEALGFWPEDFAAGRDLECGGIWLGVSRSGRIAALTNHRDLRRKRASERSRGLIVRDFLESSEAPRAFVERLAGECDRYEDFNLLAGQPAEMFFFSSIDRKPMPLKPGVYGLSNATLNTPWPKLVRARERFRAIVGAPGSELTSRILGLLEDRMAARDDELPDTGLDLERERLLSSILIPGETYGTRSSSVVLIDAQGNVRFTERTHEPGHRTHHDTELRFTLEKVADGPGA